MKPYECYGCQWCFDADDDPCVEIDGHLFCTDCADLEENRIAEEDDDGNVYLQ